MKLFPATPVLALTALFFLPSVEQAQVAQSALTGMVTDPKVSAYQMHL
jgi:hypothetical protein